MQKLSKVAKTSNQGIGLKKILCNHFESHLEDPDFCRRSECKRTYGHERKMFTVFSPPRTAFFIWPDPAEPSSDATIQKSLSGIFLYFKIFLKYS